MPENGKIMKYSPPRRSSATGPGSRLHRAPGDPSEILLRRRPSISRSCRCSWPKLGLPSPLAAGPKAKSKKAKSKSRTASSSLPDTAVADEIRLEIAVARLMRHGAGRVNKHSGDKYDAGGTVADARGIHTLRDRGHPRARQPCRTVLPFVPAIEADPHGEVA